MTRQFVSNRRGRLRLERKHLPDVPLGATVEPVRQIAQAVCCSGKVMLLVPSEGLCVGEEAIAKNSHGGASLGAISLVAKMGGLGARGHLGHEALRSDLNRRGRAGDDYEGGRSRERR